MRRKAPKLRIRSRLSGPTGRIGKALVALAVASALCSTSVYARKKHATSPIKNSVHPEVRIPVGGIGYFPPGEMPSFGYFAAVSLHFVDSKHLLFVFSIKGLLRRGHPCATSDSQRIVRAVVLEIPSGKVDRKADWDLYDFSDFLWGIGNGEFLLRRCDSLNLVGSDLVLHPLAEAAGRVVGVMMSPDRSVVVAEVKRKPTDDRKTYADIDGPHGPAQPVDAIFLRLHPLHVIAAAQLPTPGILPVVHQGFLETLTAQHRHWVINLRPFHGSDRQIAKVKSFCQPALTPVGQDVVVAAICPAKHEASFVGYDLNGTRLWSIEPLAGLYLPRFLLTANGSHFAIESLHAKAPIAALDPLGKQNIDAEIVDIYDTRTGTHIGGVAMTPVYTAGKNVDFSPDGRRVAILHDGAIEIYSLSALAKNRFEPQGTESKPNWITFPGTVVPW